jgi:Ca2+-binding EF-hand superfamily protein
MMNKHERKEIDELKEAFATFDTDGDGTISASEIESVFSRIGLKLDKQTISLMIKSVDTDGNGAIDFQEFRKMMKDGPVKLN